MTTKANTEEAAQLLRFALEAGDLNRVRRDLKAALGLLTRSVKIAKVGERSGDPVYEAHTDDGRVFVLRRREFDLPIRSVDYEVWHNFQRVAAVDTFAEFRSAYARGEFDTDTDA